MVGWPVIDLRLHVIAQHLSPHASVDSVQLGKGLNSNPEGYPPSCNGCGVIGECRNGSAPRFVNQQENRPAVAAFGSIIGRDQTVDQRSPNQPDQWRKGEEIPLRPAEVNRDGLAGVDQLPCLKVSP